MAKGTMTLLNGAVLDCYPLKHPEARVDNEMRLDTTGKYLSIGKKTQTERSFEILGENWHGLRKMCIFAL